MNFWKPRDIRIRGNKLTKKMESRNRKGEKKEKVPYPGQTGNKDRKDRRVITKVT